MSSRPVTAGKDFFCAGFTYPWYFYCVEEYVALLKHVGLSAKRVELIARTWCTTAQRLRAGCAPFFFPTPDAFPKRCVRTSSKRSRLHTSSDAHLMKTETFTCKWSD